MNLLAAEAAACRVCGSPAQDGAICRACRPQLIDLALSFASDFAAEEDAAAAPSADRYAHYEILTHPDGSAWELGRGAMGVTYKAYDTGLQSTVALKLINAQALAGDKVKERFLLEARTAARLRHPNIASVYHLGSREGAWFYSMEFIEGETVGALVGRTGPMPWRAALDIVVQITRALVVAHAQAYIHRDIKPGNIMLTRVGEGWHAKLIDFGLVKAATGPVADDDPFTAAYFAGTPQFASPEQLAGGRADARSDIYSLGATFHYLLTGVPPEGNSSDRVCRVAPEAVGELVGAMLQTNPRRRPTDAGELLARCVAARGRRGWLRRGVRMLGLVVVAALAVIACWQPDFTAPRDASADRSVGGLPPSKNIEAYTALVRAKERYAKVSKEDVLAAVDFSAQAIKLDPAYAEAYAIHAGTVAQSVYASWLPRKRMEEALRDAKRGIALRPDAPETQLALATVYLMAGFPRKSLAQARRALELDPTFVPAMRVFGLMWVVVGKPALGLPWMKAAAEHDPNNARGWAGVSEAYKDLCADDQAEWCLQHALSVDPMLLSAHHTLIHLEVLRGHFAAAADMCAKVLALRPDDTSGLKLAAQIALFRGDLLKSEEMYRSLLARDRNGDTIFYGSVRYLSALSYIDGLTGRAAEAEAFGREAEALDHAAEGDGPQPWFDLAALQAGRGEVDAAIQSFARSVKEGWLDYRTTYIDPRFETLRSQPAFQKCVVDLQQAIARTRKEAEERCARPLRLADYPLPR